MPKLPHISGKKCVAILTKMGFVVVRQKGSHVILQRNHYGCVVPMHKEIRIGTLASLLRQGKISSQEFLRIYND